MIGVRRKRPRTIRVFVVDEDRDERDFVRDLLDGEGYDVLPIGEGRLALKLLSVAEPPSLVVLAQEMSEYAGSDVLAEMERQPSWSDVPVVLMTEKLDSILASVLTNAGQPVVAKPVVAEELLASVKRILHPPRAALSRAR
jgi:two-component system, sensor histidine kinase and response regulator